MNGLYSPAPPVCATETQTAEDRSPVNAAISCCMELGDPWELRPEAGSLERWLDLNG